MQGIAAASGVRHRADRVSNRPKAPVWLGECDRRHAAREQHQAAAALRHAVVGDIEHVGDHLVASLLERGSEPFDTAVREQTGHVFEHDSLGPESEHKALKFKNEIILRVADPSSAIIRPERGKTLTGWTSPEKVQLPRFQSKLFEHILRANPPDVGCPNLGRSMVELVHACGIRVDLNCTNDIVAGLFQARGHAAAACEAVKGSRPGVRISAAIRDHTSRG